jgi:hypothetical protein
MTTADPPKRKNRLLLAAPERPIQRMRLDNPANGQRADFDKPDAAEVPGTENLRLSLILE